MTPTGYAAEFAAAVQALEGGAVQVPVAALQARLGPGDLGLARLAAGCDRLFLARPPLAPGAVFCGASHAPGPGRRDHAAGLGASPLAAWTRAMGEVAEARALAQTPAGALPVLDADLRPCGTVPAAEVLRGAGGDPVSGPVSGLGAGADLAQAAQSAWREQVERHAIARWFTGAEPARPMSVAPAVRQLEAALRGGAVERPLRYLVLPGAVPGLSVVVALSQGAQGVVPGYGCAPHPVAAACKAATEVVMGEFALHLETVAASERGGGPPEGGFIARAALFAARPDLTDPAPGPLAPGPAIRPRFAVLTRPDDGVPVLRVLAPGLALPPPGTV